MKRYTWEKREYTYILWMLEYGSKASWATAGQFWQRSMQEELCKPGDPSAVKVAGWTTAATDGRTTRFMRPPILVLHQAVRARAVMMAAVVPASWRLALIIINVAVRSPSTQETHLCLERLDALEPVGWRTGLLDRDREHPLAEDLCGEWLGLRLVRSMTCAGGALWPFWGGKEVLRLTGDFEDLFLHNENSKTPMILSYLNKF